jgi:hypothetical protein
MGARTCFAHFSEIKAKGFRSLQEKQRVSFDVKQGPKGKQATNFQPLYAVSTRPPAGAWCGGCACAGKCYIHPDYESVPGVLRAVFDAAGGFVPSSGSATRPLSLRSSGPRCVPDPGRPTLRQARDVGFKYCSLQGHRRP